MVAVVVVTWRIIAKSFSYRKMKDMDERRARGHLDCPPSFAPKTYKLLNHLLQCQRHYGPWEHLDVLFDVAWLGLGHPHDLVEEGDDRLLLGLGDGERIEALQVATDPIPILDVEVHRQQLLHQVDHVHTRYVKVIGVLPVDA